MLGGGKKVQHEPTLCQPRNTFTVPARLTQTVTPCDGQERAPHVNKWSPPDDAHE